MSTKVQKWGNSLGIRLPKAVAHRFRLTAGSYVEVLPGATEITVKLVPHTTPSLRELMRHITVHNKHAESDFGSPAGKEVW